jgi:regulator of replication initiation timing
MDEMHIQQARTIVENLIDGKYQSNLTENSKKALKILYDTENFIFIENMELKNRLNELYDTTISKTEAKEILAKRIVELLN